MTRNSLTLQLVVRALFSSVSDRCVEKGNANIDGRREGESWESDKADTETSLFTVFSAVSDGCV